MFGNRFHIIFRKSLKHNITLLFDLEFEKNNPRMFLKQGGKDADNFSYNTSVLVRESVVPGVIPV